MGERLQLFVLLDERLATGASEVYLLRLGLSVLEVDTSPTEDVFDRSSAEVKELRLRIFGITEVTECS